MDKNRLIRILDTAIVVVIIQLVRDYLYYPYPRSFEGVWEMRAELFRVGIAVLWLTGLWLGMYRPWDAAERVSPATVALGVGLLLCVVGIHYFTGFAIHSTVARFTQLLYGGWMLLTSALTWGLQWALERANTDAPECVESSRRWRRALAVAFAIMVVGEVLCAGWRVSASRVFAAIAGLWLLGAGLAQLCRKRGEA